MDAWVVLFRPDGSRERHRIEGEQVTLGRSPTAGIPLINAEDLLPEHMLLAPRPDGCWVAVAQEAQGTARVGGKILQAAVLPWGTEIDVGQNRLQITDKLAADKKKGGTGVSSPVVIAMFVLIPLAGWLLLSDPETDFPLATDAPHPDLFDDVASCEEDREAAVTIARDSAEEAHHRAERYPFDAQDGIEAVRLYGLAESCYRAGGLTSDSTRIGRERQALARRLEEDYRTHRLRLERALKFQRHEDALAEAQNILALTRHRQGDAYVQWLTLLERRLQLILDQTLRAAE
jgi:hypothetical protein